MQTTIAKLKLNFMWFTFLDVKEGTSITSNPVNLAHVRMIQNYGGGCCLFSHAFRLLTTLKNKQLVQFM
jgi:hypothetical protein